jgi:hypothetical protein
MSGHGVTGQVRGAAALVLGLLLAGGVAGCEYEDTGGPQPTAATDRISPSPASSPTTDPATLDLEASNFAELKQRLGVALGTLLLEDSVAVGGQGRASPPRTQW